MTRAGLTAALLAAGFAWAAPVRLAVVYGHNGGDAAHRPLKYAEADAARVADALVEVGGVARGDLKLLTGRPLKELEAALEWAKVRASGRAQVQLVVYLSAHADAEQGLLPAGEQLKWARLKQLVAATGAKARVTIVDGCASSGLLEASAREAPTFTIEAEDTLTVKGDAFITSSASDEPSLEAGQLQGSVFTQHLVAGLRGAADRSQDGAVSLEEAYRFAFERTTEGQSGQHPGFGNRLAGYGELVLARPGAASGVLVPEGALRISVREPGTGRKLFSARRPEARRLAVPPGTWIIEVEQEAGAREGQVSVTPGAFASIEVDRLGVVARAASLVRLGDDVPCYAVRLSRPEPRLERLVPKLAAVAPGCPEGRPPLATLVLEPAAKGQVRVRAQATAVPAPLDVSGPAGDVALLDAVRGWVAGNLATTKRNP